MKTPRTPPDEVNSMFLWALALALLCAFAGVAAASVKPKFDSWFILVLSFASLFALIRLLMATHRLEKLLRYWYPDPKDMKPTRLPHKELHRSRNTTPSPPSAPMGCYDVSADSKPYFSKKDES